MKSLHLTLKKKWFDMIRAGFKPEEYREIKDHWVRRLISVKEDMESAVWDEFINDLNNPYHRHNGPSECMKYFDTEFKKFDAVEFRNGYGKTVPSITMKLKLISIGTGCTRIGAANEEKYYFILHLGERIEPAVRTSSEEYKQRFINHLISAYAFPYEAAVNEFEYHIEDFIDKGWPEDDADDCISYYG